MAGVFGKVSNDKLDSTGGFGNARKSSPFAPDFPSNGSVFGIPWPSSNASTSTFTFNQVSGANAFGSSSSFSSLHGSATASNTLGTSTPSSFLTHGGSSTPSTFGASVFTHGSTFGTQPSFSSSSNSLAFGTTSIIGSLGPFNSTTSRGPMTSFTSFGQGSGSSHSASLSRIGTSAGAALSTYQSSPFAGASALAPSYTFQSPPSTFRIGVAPTTTGMSAVGGHTYNKGNTAAATPTFPSAPISQAMGSHFGQTSNVFGTTPFNPFSTFSSAASPTLSAGSRIESYKSSDVFEDSRKLKAISISAMPIYTSKSHEELRLEDYELNSGGRQHSQEINRLQLASPISSSNTQSPPFFPPTYSTNMNTTTIASPFNPSTSFAYTNTRTFPIPSTGPAFSTDISSTTSPFPSTSPGPSPIFSQFDAKTLAVSNASNLASVTTQVPVKPLPPVFPVATGDQVTANSFTPLVNSFNPSQPHPSLVQQLSATDKVRDHIVAVKNPFGSESATSELSGSHSDYFSLGQHGISSIPVADKPTTPRTRVSSFLTSRHHSLRPLPVNVRRYHSSRDGPKVPFFDRAKEVKDTCKASIYIVPRENPRSVLAAFTELTHVSPSKEEPSSMNLASSGEYEGGIGVTAKKDQSCSCTSNSLTDHISVASDNAKVVNKLLIPKLQRSDYYTEPRIEKLASIERINPGFCGHVKDFVVGREGYGWIKFYGETDVRGLDLDSLIHFNVQEVIVYDDKIEKPPVGQGLNKAAEINLLHIKCIDKKTGEHYINGKKVDKFIEKLKKVAEKQGAEFASYDAVKGEWKFRVPHF